VTELRTERCEVPYGPRTQEPEQRQEPEQGQAQAQAQLDAQGYSWVPDRSPTGPLTMVMKVLGIGGAGSGAAAGGGAAVVGGGGASAGREAAEEIMKADYAVVGAGSGSRVLGRKMDSIPFSPYHLMIIGVLGLVGNSRPVRQPSRPAAVR